MKYLLSSALLALSLGGATCANAVELTLIAPGGIRAAITQMLPDFELAGWDGVMVPERTPPEIVARLNRELNAVLALPDVRKRLEEGGLEPVGGSPEDFASRLRAVVTGLEPRRASSSARASWASCFFRPENVNSILARLAPYSFDRIYGAFPQRTVLTDAKQVVLRSAQRFMDAIGASERG